MSRFRKIDTRTFADSKFRQLTRPQPCGQYLWLWLLTGPKTCQIPGVIYNVGARGMAELLGWPEQGFQEAFREVLSLGMVRADFDAPLVFIPNAIKYNRPQSPNVVTAWSSAWEEVPECELKEQIRQVLGDFMKGQSEGFQEAFDRACPKSSPNQEQLAGAENRNQEQDKSVGAPLLISDEHKCGGSKRTIHKEELPEWMPLEQWYGFLEMRKSKKAELKGRALKLIVNSLEKLRARGEDIAAVLDQSTVHGWKAVFPIKQDNTRARGKSVDLKEIDHTAGTRQRTDGSLAF